MDLPASVGKRSNEGWTGTSAFTFIVARWVLWKLKRGERLFPNAYFSFNAMVRSYNREQRAALSLLPRSRLLLETDSPHQPVGGGVIYATPAYIGEVGELVAEIRGDSLQALLEQTQVNAEAIYVWHVWYMSLGWDFVRPQGRGTQFFFLSGCG